MEETASNAAPRWPRGAAVIGAGTMGLGVAEYLAAAGVRVCISEATPELARQALERLARRAQGHGEAGLVPPGAAGPGGGGEGAGQTAAAVAGAEALVPGAAAPA